jgi:hypothetical protein
VELRSIIHSALSGIDICSVPSVQDTLARTKGPRLIDRLVFDSEPKTASFLRMHGLLALRRPTTTDQGQPARLNALPKRTWSSARSNAATDFAVPDIARWHPVRALPRSRSSPRPLSQIGARIMASMHAPGVAPAANVCVHSSSMKCATPGRTTAAVRGTDRAASMLSAPRSPAVNRRRKLGGGCSPTVVGGRALTPDAGKPACQGLGWSTFRAVNGLLSKRRALEPPGRTDTSSQRWPRARRPAARRSGATSCGSPRYRIFFHTHAHPF